MLKTIKITNFHSIGNEQELSFEIAPKEILDNSACKINDKTSLNLVVCTVGHNASGKTNTLKALNYICWLVNDAYTNLKSSSGTIVDPHKLHSKENTKFELEFFNDGILYQYIIELNNQEIIHEYLGQNIVKGFSRIFECTRNGNNWDYKSPSIKINKEDQKRFQILTNIPLLSLLISTGYLSQITFFNKILSNVVREGKVSVNSFSSPFYIFNKLERDNNLCKNVLSYIKEFDFSISDFSFQEVELVNSTNPDVKRKEVFLKCQHGGIDKGFSLNFFDESDGAKQSISILTEILPILQSGGVAILDEIEDGLHPEIIQKIIALFERKKTNPNKAQLLFSTHQHILLNDRTKTQIFFAEKNNESLETEIYRLDDIEGVRNDENYFNKYTAGSYGATPQLGVL